MSLTLNDEQERALRAFWNAHEPKTASAALQYSTGGALLRAIDPLMKPWKKAGGFGDPRWKIVGPGGLQIECTHTSNEKGEAYALCDRVLRLLNESEARNG